MTQEEFYPVFQNILANLGTSAQYGDPGDVFKCLKNQLRTVCANEIFNPSCSVEGWRPSKRVKSALEECGIEVAKTSDGEAEFSEIIKKAFAEEGSEKEEDAATSDSEADYKKETAAKIKAANYKKAIQILMHSLKLFLSPSITSSEKNPHSNKISFESLLENAPFEHLKSYLKSAAVIASEAQDLGGSERKDSEGAGSASAAVTRPPTSYLNAFLNLLGYKNSSSVAPMADAH